MTDVEQPDSSESAESDTEKQSETTTMNTNNSRNHDARTDIEVTLRPGIRQTSAGKERCWFAEADGYRNATADTASEALSLVGEQVDSDTGERSPSGDSRRSISELFADDDGNPFAIAPSDESPAEADLLRRVELHLTETVMKTVNELPTVESADLRSVVRLTIKETYRRRGFTHNQPPAELRDRQDPIPEDFHGTLEDIISDPEQYVKLPDVSPAVESMTESAVRLIQLLPEPDDWERAASTTESERHQRHRDTASGVRQ